MSGGGGEKEAAPDGAAAHCDRGEARLRMAAAHMTPCRKAEDMRLVPQAAGGWARARLPAAAELGAADKRMAIRTEASIPGELLCKTAGFVKVDAKGKPGELESRAWLLVMGLEEKSAI